MVLFSGTFFGADVTQACLKLFRSKKMFNSTFLCLIPGIENYRPIYIRFLNN